MRVWLTINEAAQRLGLGRDRVRAGIDSGVIPAVRIGRRFVILREPLEEFIRTGKNPLAEAQHSAEAAAAGIFFEPIERAPLR